MPKYCRCPKRRSPPTFRVTRKAYVGDGGKLTSGWTVQSTAHEIEVKGSKSDAVEQAKKYAEKRVEKGARRARVVVHDSRGRIQYSRTYKKKVEKSE